MGSFYMESTQINYRRDETVKTVDQKLQELSETSAIDTDIAPVFKSTNTYAPGDMVYYRNKLYVFNVEHTGAWAAADVTATDVTTEISSLNSGLTNVDIALSVPDGTGKNLIPMTVSGIKAYNTDGTWSGNDYTLNNVVFTILTDSDGYVTGINVNGTASARSDFNLVTPGVYVKGGSYKLNGCPADGSSSKYRIQVWNFTQNTGYNDYGTEADANVNTGDNMGYQITIYNGYAASNLKFYPMLRLSTITDPTFAPYIPSVDARLDAVESGLNVVETGKINCINITAGNNPTYSFTFDHSGNDVYAFVFGKFGQSATRFSIAVISHPNNDEAFCMSLGEDTISVTCSGHTVTVTGPSNYARVTIISSAGIVN